MQSLILLLLLCIIGCSHQPIILKGKHSSYQGLVYQNIKLTNTFIICFSEIKNQILNGIYCQTDAGFELFSAGYTENNYQVEVLNRFLLPDSVNNIILYAQLGIFEQPNMSGSDYRIHKEGNRTDIYDNFQRKVIVWTKQHQ